MSEEFINRHTRPHAKSGAPRRSIPANPNPFYDQIYQEQEQHSGSEKGTLSINANVMATFDSRLINGQDFVFTEVLTWDIQAVSAPLTVTASYTVPAGFNAVVRGYRYEMLPAVTIGRRDLLLRWAVNEVPIIGLQQLTHGQIVNDWIETFFIAGQNSRISAIFSAPRGLNTSPGKTREIAVEFYGNLMKDTGKELAFEVGNTTEGKPIKY